MTDVVRILDGNVQLFKRAGTSNWNMRFSLPGKGQVKRTLGTSDLKEAKRLAKARYFEAQGRDRMGLSHRGFMFEKVADQFLQNYERKVTRGEKKPVDLRNVTGVVRRYFKPYFEGRTIDEIFDSDIEEYKEWRKDYWLSGPGKDIKFIYYERAGRHLKRPVKGEVPSRSRQRQELSFLRQIFQYAASKKYIQQRDVPEIENVPLKDNSGAGLDDEEFKRLREVCFDRWSEVRTHPHVAHSRRLLVAYINIAAKTFWFCRNGQNDCRSA